MSLFPIHVFTAGSDAGATQGDPRRFNISRDGYTPSTQGWVKVMDFQAFSAPVAGAIPIYVAEAGNVERDKALDTSMLLLFVSFTNNIFVFFFLLLEK